MSDYEDDNRGRGSGPSIFTVDKTVSVLTERIESLKTQLGDVGRKLDTALALFATKEELKSVQTAFEDKLKEAGVRTGKIEAQISWAVKIVLAIVLTAVVGTVVYTRH